MPNWDPGSGWIGSGEQEPAFFRDFRDRLGAASANEEARIAGLQRDAQLQGERQLAGQYGQAIGLGYGAAQGGGPAGLRGAAYGAGAMRQQQSNDAAMMKAVQDQAFRQAYLDMLGRRGGYELGAAGLATKGYGMGQDRMAAGMEGKARDSAQDAQEQANTTGMVIGSVGAAAGAAGNLKSGKEYKEGVADGRAQVEDATLNALRRREAEKQDEDDAAWRRKLAGPQGSVLRGLYEGVGAVQKPASTGMAAAAAPAAAARAPGYYRVRRALPAVSPPVVTMQRPGTEPAGTYGYDPALREFTPDVPDAVTLPPLEVKSDPRFKQNIRPAAARSQDMAMSMPRDAGVREQHDPKAALEVIQRGLRMFGGHPVELSMRDKQVKSDPRFKQNIRPTSGRAEDMTADELGLALDVEDAKMGQALRDQGPVRPDGYDTPLSADEEQRFRAWKARYAPNDSGMDYDLRGAFKAGVTPDPRTGHWPDTFKKPNHPTFSVESQYADAAPGRAGRWAGDRYIQAAQARGADRRAADIGAQLDAEGKRTRAAMRPEDFDQALSASAGKTYQYTPEARAQYPDQTRGGDLYGPMADNLRQTSIGRSMLTPDGKAIDIQGATVGNLGLTARLHDRLSAVERALGIEDANTTRKLREGGPVRTR